MPSPDTEAILAQDEWLRRIAGGLARDPDLADDLVQDAWVANLQRGAGRRPWLVKVLWNVRVSRFRAAASQRERARRLAEMSPFANEATDEIAADLELRERVAHELRGLEEPYRTAIYHRFVSDLSVKEIARRTGVAPSTVSERITRGLARLKLRLDGAYDGDRRAWSALLLPMARPEGLAALGLGTLAMTTFTKWTLAAAAACALLLTVSQWRPFAGDRHGLELAAFDDANVVRPAQAEESEVRLARAPDPGRAGRGNVAAADPPRASPAPAAAAGPQARIKARFRLPDGRPAAGASWKVFGWPGNDEAVRTHGLPQSWEPKEGTLDASGDVDVTFDAPGAYQFTFDVESEGCVDASWRWHELVPDETKDLGEVTLRPASWVSGRLVGPDGQPLVEGNWRVTVKEQRDRGHPPAERWQATWASSMVNPGTAAFLVEGVPPGPVMLAASSDRFGRFDGPLVDVLAGGVADVVVRVDTLVSESTSVIVDLDFDAVVGSRAIDRDRIALVGPLGARTTASPRRGWSGSYVFEEVGDGELQLVIDDPGFVRETREGVRAGDRIQVPLRGSGALELEVVGADDEPILLYSVELEKLGGMMGSRLVVHDGEQPLVDGRVAGMVPGDYRLIVRSADRSAAADVLGLGAGETRTTSLRLDGSATIRGRATYADGNPAVRIRARLVTPAEVNDGPDSFVISQFSGGGIPEQNRHEVDRTATDPDGCFALAAPGPGRYIVMLGEDSGARSESALIEVVRGSVPQPLELVAARAARIRGRIETPAGLDLRGWRVVPFWPGRRMTFQSWFEPAIVNSEGSFELPELSPGRFELHLLRPGSGMGWGGEGGSPSRGRRMAQFTLGDGETVERTFPFPGAVPSNVTFEVELSGAPDGECELEVMTADIFRPSEVASGSTPTLGPVQVDAGERTVRLRGDGWGWVSPTPIEIPEGATMTVPLKVELTPRRVLLVAAGEPVAGAKCYVRRADTDYGLFSLEADDGGVLDLRLAPGTYDLSFSPLAKGEEGRTVRVEWPLAADAPELSLDGD